ncbi:MAG: type II toxin-antitoxin system PemK/MazF family toxin [Blastocatellia bacterium]
MPNRAYNRGEVYWGNLDPQKGSEQAGSRPVVILQNDLLNRTGNTVVVVPLTHTTRFAHLPCCLLIPKRGLRFNARSRCCSSLPSDSGLGQARSRRLHHNSSLTSNDPA